MKLKNSYVLLMVMAIFLLISVGSVCASDIADVEDVVSADDGSDVVLANESTAPEKIDTEIVSDNNVRIEKGQDQKIPVAVNDNKSEPIDVSKENLTVSEGSKQLNFTYSNNEIKLSNLTAGNHSLLINYLGNNEYKNSTKNIILSIVGDYHLEASDATVNQTNIAEVPVTYTNGVDIKDATASEFRVNLAYENGTKQIFPSKYENGKLILDLSSVENRAYYNMTITYTGSGGNEIIGPKKLTRITIVKIIPVNTEVYYQDGNFTFQIVDDYTDKPIADEKISLEISLTMPSNSVIISSTRTFNTDSNGILTINNDNNLYLGTYVPVGNYNITLKGKDGTSGSLKTTIKVNKIKSKITVDKYDEYIGSDKNITIRVVNAETGNPLRNVEIFFNMTDSTGKEVVFTRTGSDNKTVKANTANTNENGTVKIPMNLVAGKYTIFTNLTTSDSYETSKTTATATIKKIPVAYSIDITTGVITVTNKLTKKAASGVYVLVKFDGSDNKLFLSQTDKNGKVEIKTVGKHKMQVSDADSRYTGSAVTKTITNKKITAKCSAPKVTDYYKGVKVFTVKLTTSAKKPIYDAKISLVINGYKQKVTTGLNGQVRLTLDKLTPGTYKVVVTSGDTKSFTIKKITTKIVIKKAPAKLTPKKLTAKKGASKYFTVTVKNTKTKKVIKGVKVKIKVYTGKKYKTYSVKTNSKGIAKLNVKSLKVGSHKVVITSANKYVTAKTAKSTIKITKK